MPRLLFVLGLLIVVATFGTAARAQDTGGGSAPPPAKDLTREAMQVLRAQRSAPEPGAPGTLAEIFPDSSKVFMAVHNTDPIPIELARRGGPWICASGCRLENVTTRQTDTGDSMLRSMKLQTPTLPLPVTIWGRRGTGRNELQQLYFDPVLIGRRSYAHVCAYRPPEGPAAGGRPKKPELCTHEQPATPTPDSGELSLGLRWPDQSDAAQFQYIAVVDSCGNARVQPFQRTFTVPVLEVAGGGCGKPDGKVLKVFPEGGWIRVTAFNLDEPATGDIVNLTYRVTIPPLENLVETEPARLLFPDALVKDLKIDCGPLLLKAAPDAAGIPRPPPGIPPAPPGVKAPPGAGPPGAAGPGSPPPKGAKAATVPPSLPPQPQPPPPGAPPGADKPETGPGAKPLAHESVVISPEPLRQGNCRLQIMGQLKRRLAAPLALQVLITRTDVVQDNGSPVILYETPWVLTPSSDYLPIPPLSANYDGDSRIRVAVFSDPLSPSGKSVLLSDATRVASTPRNQQSSTESIVGARRLIGSVTIHSVPLCGESNFETLDAAGSCLRAYITVPIMLASLQVTRAPWVEKPLITRQFLNSIGIALAIDSYDPVERKAFPVALQIGGFLQNLEDDRVGLLGYFGIAPTIPVLGEKGNTTSLGLLGGAGVSYVFNDTGPDEGLKPAAFLSVVVQVGQATPRLGSGAQGKAEAAFSQGASASSSGSSYASSKSSYPSTKSYATYQGYAASSQPLVPYRNDPRTARYEPEPRHEPDPEPRYEPDPEPMPEEPPVDEEPPPEDEPVVEVSEEE